MDKIYILLPVHNRSAVTRRFVESLVSQQYQGYHLVLLDDGCTDGTVEMVRSYVGALTVLRGTGEWWWGGALHQGYLWLLTQGLSENDVVLLMNDDTEIEPDYLATALDILQENSNVLLVSRCYDRRTKILVDPGTYHMDLARLKFSTVDGDDQANCASTRGLFLRATAMLAVGGFHPRLLPHYLSDIEYTWRAQRKGLKILSDSRLSLLVDEEATGYHEHHYEADSIPSLLKRFFSRKSSSNPVYWTSFILLACPWPWKIINIPLVWVASLYRLLKLMFTCRARGAQGKG